MNKYIIASLLDGHSTKSGAHTPSVLNKKSDLTPRTAYQIGPQTQSSDCTCLVNACTINNNSHTTLCSPYASNTKKPSEIIFLGSESSNYSPRIITNLINQRRNSAFILKSTETKDECFTQRDRRSISRCPTARYASPTMNSRRRVYPVNQIHAGMRKSKDLNGSPLVFQTQINGKTVRIYKKPVKVGVQWNTLKNKSENLKEYSVVCKPSVCKVVACRIKDPQEKSISNDYKDIIREIKKTFTIDCDLCP